MEYGKKTKHESYFNGALKSVKTEYSIPTLVKNRNDAMIEILKALELINDKQTCDVTINIKADPRTFDYKLITKTYIINSDT